MSNRELKFRAWHKEAEEMLFGPFQSHYFSWKEDGQPVEIMQWVGLKDINCRNIYFDCSIFEFEYKDKQSSTYKLIGSMSFNIEEQRSEIEIYGNIEYSCLYFDSQNMTNFEIIGNIYENEDLLK